MVPTAWSSNRFALRTKSRQSCPGRRRVFAQMVAGRSNSVLTSARWRHDWTTKARKHRAACSKVQRRQNPVLDPSAQPPFPFHGAWMGLKRSNFSCCGRAVSVASYQPASCARQTKTLGARANRSGVLKRPSSTRSSARSVRRPQSLRSRPHLLPMGGVQSLRCGCWDLG